MNRRVLVIDDQRAIHDDFRRILAPGKTSSKLSALEAGVFGSTEPARGETTYRVDSAYQGEEGLEFVRRAVAEKDPYAVVFSDVRMPPGWDGIETLSRIFEVDPHILAVLCTAFSDYEWAKISERIKCMDRYLILKKPFEAIEIRQIAASLSARWFEEANLHRANRQLALSYSTTHILSHAQSLEAQGDELLRSIADTFGWSFGALWATSEDSGVVGCVASFGAAGLPDKELRAMTASAGMGQRGLPLRALGERSDLHLVDPTQEDDARAETARGLGLSAAMVFPVLIGERVEFVLEFWDRSSATPTEETAALMRDVCSKIGAFIERQRISAELQRSKALSSLSTPLIPLSAHVVVMPIVGDLDPERSARMRETLLRGVAERGVHTAILDITGVPSLDARTAEELAMTARAVRLLGARMVLTGIQPDAAQQLVAIGVDLSGILTLRALEEGIAFAMGTKMTTHTRRR